MSRICNGFIRIMGYHWQPSNEFSSGCLFMATIFTFTSIYKLCIKIDKELSLWMPLHIGGAILSFYHAFKVNRWSRVMGYGLLVGSASVFSLEIISYIIKGHLDWQAFASLDMQKQDVRDKIGSSLIFLAIGLQLDAFGGIFLTKKCTMLLIASTILCTICLLQTSILSSKEEQSKIKS